ncbi:MAG TPA: MFS transporter [Lapillicoccus sp.]|nr:MFS transporter [Lapillicoccus sp.]
MTWAESVDVLRQRRFAWYFAARTVSTAGTAMAPVALAFAVLHLTDSGSALAQVLTARTAAMVLFLLIGGVVSDRMSRTTVLQLAHAATAITQGAAAALVISGHADLWMITGIEAVNGAASAFTFPAMMGIVPLIVDRTRLQPANALLAFSRSGLTMIGPAVAGLLVVTVGPGWALAFDAMTYVVAILCLWQVRLPRRDPVAVPERTSMLTELRDGWSEFSSRTWLWVVVVVFGLLNAIHFGAIGVLGPLVSTRVPALGAGGWGLALSAEAVGTVVATVVMLRVSFRYPLRVGMIAIAAIAVPIVMLGLSPSTWPLVIAMFVAGSGTELFGVGWSTAMQEHIPEAVLSRVSSYDALGSFVAMPLGSLLFGLLADRFDPEPVLIVSGVVYVALALGTLFSRSVRNLEHEVVHSRA